MGEALTFHEELESVPIQTNVSHYQKTKVAVRKMLITLITEALLMDKGTEVEK